MEIGETSQNTVTGGIFDGEPEIEWNEGEEVEGEETEADTQKPESKAKEPEAADDDVADFLTVRYNKADKKLTKKEALEYAQKGMNYDHVYGELQSYRDGPIGKAIKAYADAAGMSVEKYAEMMMEQQAAAAEKKALQELQDQYPDAPEDLLRDYAKMKLGENKAKAEDAEEAKQQKAWADALEEYPDISADSIPQDVHDAVANGMTPIEALRMHELTTLRAKVAELTSAKDAKQKQDENRARSIGSAAGVNSGGEAEDDFLAGMASRARS
jgi:hypothetical protein